MSVQQLEPRFVDSNQSDERWPLREAAVIGTWCIVAAAAVIPLAGLVFEYCEQLWNAEHYRFFPMLILAAVWLAWRRTQTLREPLVQPVYLSIRIGLWTLALLATALALFAQSPLLAALAVLTLIPAGLYELGGGIALRRFLPVWSLLLLVLRLPFNWDQRMIVGLQRAATYWSSGTLDLLGIRHLADGVVIRLPEQDFFIDEACSGVHSLFAAAAFVAVFAVAARKSFPRFAALMIAALFWVFVANAFRVLAVVVLSTRYGLPVVDGLGHELLGVIVFAAVIGLVLSTDRLLLFIFPAKELFADERETPEPMKVAVPSRNLSFPLTIAACFIAVAASIQALPSSAAASAIAPLSPREGLTPVPEDALPESWNGWSKVEFQVRERDKNDPAGEISRIWYYRKGRLIAAVSIDGPFDAWHDIEVCYDALGYTAQSREDIPVSDGGTSSAGYTELMISNEVGRHGHVLFMAYSQDGEALRPPPSRHASFARFLSIWNDRFAGKEPVKQVTGSLYQVQVFSESGLAFTIAEQEELRKLFHQMRLDIAKLTVNARQSELRVVAPHEPGGVVP